MKNFLHTVAYSVIFAASSAAFASPLPSSISFTGTDSVAAGGIDFASTYGSNTVLTSGTGIFTGFGAGHNATFSDFSFSSPLISGNGELLFELLSNDGTEGTEFKATSYSLANNTYSFSGVILMYACKGTANTCVLAGSDSGSATLSFTNKDDTSFNLAVSTAPEPSSLVLLGTGLMGAGLMFRKRRVAAIA